MAIKLGNYRDDVNLADNPSNYKKKIVVTGIFEKYCGIPGLVDLTKVVLDGKEIAAGSGNNQGDYEIPADAIFSETFADSLETVAFSRDSLTVTLPLAPMAETIADGGTAMPGFFKKAGVVYLVLGHTTMRPSAAAITDITSGSATPENNQNAIAYPIANVDLQGKNTGDPEFNDAKKQYEFSVDQGVTTALTTISTAVDSTTYSFDDRAGNYEAYIILTDTTT